MGEETGMTNQITEADRAALGGLARDRMLVIDVGTFTGASAKAMLLAMPEAGRLITIDLFQEPTAMIESGFGPPEVWSGSRMFKVAQARLASFGERATIICGRSPGVAALLASEIADLVFIDAAHDYDSVVADIQAWSRVVRPGGLIAGHDFDKPALGMAEEQVRGTMHLEIDSKTNVHTGVAAAVVGCFRKINLAENESTIWWAPKEWLKTA